MLLNCLRPPQLRIDIETPDEITNSGRPPRGEPAFLRVQETGEDIACCSLACTGFTLFAVYIGYVAFNIFVYQLFERTPDADPRSFEEMLFATLLLR